MPARDQTRNVLAVLERELPGEGVGPEDARRVVELLRREYGGMRLYVNRSEPRPARPGGSGEPPR